MQPAWACVTAEESLTALHPVPLRYHAVRNAGAVGRGSSVGSLMANDPVRYVHYGLPCIRPPGNATVVGLIHANMHAACFDAALATGTLVYP
jgi:hypothetical protein